MDNGPVDQSTSRARDQRLTVVLACFGVLVVMTQVGSIMAPTLVKSHPELLLALSSRIRHLLFAVPAGINPIAYSIIPVVRIGAAGVVCFLLGRWYGARGMAWLDNQFGGETPASFRWLQRAVEKAAPVLVFLMPASNIVCVLVGLRRMRPQIFAACLVSGIAFRLIWVWYAAKQFENELKDALDWIAKYQWWLVVGFFALSFAQSARRSARQRKNERTVD